MWRKNVTAIPHPAEDDVEMKMQEKRPRKRRRKRRIHYAAQLRNK